MAMHPTVGTINNRITLSKPDLTKATKIVDVGKGFNRVTKFHSTTLNNINSNITLTQMLFHAADEVGEERRQALVQFRSSDVNCTSQRFNLRTDSYRVNTLITSRRIREPRNQSSTCRSR